MKLLHSYQPLHAPANGDGADGGAGSGSPAAFDQAAFTAAIMGEVSKTLLGFGKTLKADMAKQFAPKAPAAAAISDPDLTAGDQPVNTDPAAGDKAKPDPALAAQLRLLERRNKELADQFTAMKTESDATKAIAEKKEQDSVVRTKLAKYKFADETAGEDAFEIFGGKIKRNEDGAFTGPDGTPIDQFLEEGMRLKPYLLAPKDVGGAGARTGKAPGAGKAIDLDSIKSGMSAADAAAAASQISAVLAQLQQGR